MTAVCGYIKGLYNSPAACNPGFDCVQWATPAVFGCTSGPSTLIATTCVNAGDYAPPPTAGLTSCGSDAPYCATISLSWGGYYYTHWECATKTGVTSTLLATPTITGSGLVSTHNLNAVAAADTAPPSDKPKSSNNSSGNQNGGSPAVNTTAIVGAVVGAVAAVVIAIAAICVKRHSRRILEMEEERFAHSGGGGRGSNDRAVAIRRPEDVARFVRNGQGVNVYVNELHYHDHGGGRGAGLGRLLN